jgi:hypothetical protein
MARTATSAFWEDHNAWLKRTMASQLVVEISDPESMLGFLRSFTTYRVVCHRASSSSAGVRRRFRDFEVLREALVLRYVGVLIPALPDKKVVRKHAAEVIRERLRGLGLFLDRIVSNPYTRSDTLVEAFLNSVTWDGDAVKVSARVPLAPSTVCSTCSLTLSDCDCGLWWRCAGARGCCRRPR